MRWMLLAGAAALAACATATVAELGPPPPAPAYLKNLPDDPRDPRVNYTQANVGDAEAPDLLLSRDGKIVTTAAHWKQSRRPQIVRLLVNNQYGGVTLPRSSTVTSTRSEDGVRALDGVARRTQLAITSAGRVGTNTIDVVYYVPAQATGPSPLVLMVNFNPNVLVSGDDAVKESDAWTQDGRKIPGREARLLGRPDIKAYLARGYGVALVYYGQIEPDFKGGSAHGLRSIHRVVNEDARGPTDAGAITTWAEGLSIVREHLAHEPAIDAKRIALYGVSRLGKTVLWAGALDRDFAAVIAVCSGEGGAALSRRRYGETIGTMAGAFPYWFAPRWYEYADDPAASPVDAHMVISLIAPRPLLLITGETDAWSDPYGEFLAARLATPVWRLFGKEGVDAAPVLDQPTGGALTYMMHTGGHGPAPQDTAVILDFLDREMANSAPVNAH